jgi:hypothetical protein
MNLSKKELFMQQANHLGYEANDYDMGKIEDKYFALLLIEPLTIATVRSILRRYFS